MCIDTRCRMDQPRSATQHPALFEPRSKQTSKTKKISASLFGRRPSFQEVRCSCQRQSLHVVLFDLDVFPLGCGELPESSLDAKARGDLNGMRPPTKDIPLCTSYSTYQNTLLVKLCKKTFFFSTQVGRAWSRNTGMQ